MRELTTIDDAAVRAVVPAVLRAVLDRLAEEASVWLVGGTVRDLWVGRDSCDLDVAVDLGPERIAALMQELVDFQGVVFDADLGVLNLEEPASGWDLAVSAFRGEADYGPDRRPQRVWFGVDLETDALRRDFTCNACYLSWPGAVLVDPCGGRADLEAGVLRVVGSALPRLAEDPLRVLRGVRFAARYDLTPCVETQAALRAVAPRCADLVPSRQYGELSCLLVERGAVAWRMLDDFGLTSVLVPEIAAAEGPDVLGAALERAAAEPADRWAALGVVVGPRPLDEVLSRLQAPRGVRRDALAVTRLAWRGEADDPRRLVAGVPAAWLAGALPRLLGVDRASRLLAVLRGSGGYPGAALVESGDLVAAGVPIGPALGAAMRQVRCALADGMGEPTQDDVAGAIRDAMASVVKRDSGTSR